jgi:hypothetical protein
MRSAITALEFIYFLIRFFYSDEFDASTITAFLGPSTLSEDEEKAFHLNWRTAQAEPVGRRHRS